MEKPKNIAIVAAGICPWGEREATFRDMISEAGKACFDNNKNIGNKDIDGVILGTAVAQRAAIQGKATPLVCECLGIYPTLYQCVENQCQTGSIAIKTGVAMIRAGMAQLVLVIGVEKMTLPIEDVTLFTRGLGTDRDWEACYGMAAPPMFALAARAHMEKYGTTEEQMALVSVKNHRNSIKNPYARFREQVSLTDVLESRTIASPLKLYDCCGNADGAAAVILAPEDKARDLTDKPVWFLGAGQGFSGYTMANLPKDLTSWTAVRISGENAYSMAGLSPKDIDVAELHDCFTISEIIEYEELGFCEKGEGARFLESGLADYGGSIVTQPRGGLIGCGHPLGATGVGQAYEIYLQLRTEAGDRQVDDAKFGLCQTMSNTGSESHVLIFGNDIVS
jgi:acetyl-CoA C-acetyltransferase